MFNERDTTSPIRGRTSVHKLRLGRRTAAATAVGLLLAAIVACSPTSSTTTPTPAPSTPASHSSTVSPEGTIDVKSAPVYGEDGTRLGTLHLGQIIQVECEGDGADGSDYRINYAGEGVGDVPEKDANVPAASLPGQLTGCARMNIYPTAR